MRISRVLVLIIISFLFLNANGCGANEFPEKNIVAKYDNDHYVTVSELNQYIKDWLYYKKFIDRYDVFNNALNDLLVNQFKRMDFFERGLDKDSNLIQSINRPVNEELVSEYFESQYLAKYANEEYAKKVYGFMNKEVIYQVIALNKPEKASQKELDELKEKALAIKSEIDNGGDFNSLVAKYSQDVTSVMNKGFMPPIGWRQSLVNPVDGIIFALNNNEVRVINSYNAILVVRIAAINIIQVAPYDSMKTEIIATLKKGFVTASLEEYENDKKELIDENNLQWKSDALQEIVKWTNIPNFIPYEYARIIKEELDKGNNKTILTYNNGVVDYRELLRLLENILIIGETGGLTENYLKNFILEAIRTELIVKKAEALDLKKNVFHPFTTSPIIKNKLVALYNQAVIETNIPEATEDVIEQYFKENETTLYYQLEKRNLFVMVFPNESGAVEAAGKIKNGTPFEKVTGSYLVRTYIKERSGEIKSIAKDEKPLFAETGFELKESEVSDPVEFNDEDGQTKYALIKCYHIRPEKQLTFEDVKNTINEDYMNEQRRILEEDIEVKLKSKYQPVINEEVLEKLISAN